MHGGGEVGREGGIDKFAAMLRDAKILAEKRLGGGGAEADNHFGMNSSDLGIKPRAARGDFGGIGFFVDAAFSPGLPFEMFHGIGDVNFFAVDSGFDERVVEKLAGGADERFAGQVFLIAGLLADEHQLAMGGAFAENGLRAELPEIAIFASFCGFAQLWESGFGGNQIQLLG